MRKFKMVIHYEAVKEIEVEVFNHQTAKDEAWKEAWLEEIPGMDIVDVSTEISNVEDTGYSFEDTVERLADSFYNTHDGYQYPDILEATKKIVKFGDPDFEFYGLDSLHEMIQDELDYMIEDLEKTIEKCRGENF